MKKERGAFKGYASMLIRSRIIDYHRKETRHEGHASLYEERGDGDRTLADELCDDRDHIGEEAWIGGDTAGDRGAFKGPVQGRGHFFRCCRQLPQTGADHGRLQKGHGLRSKGQSSA